MKVLSVIIPSYNCAGFLEKNIPSYFAEEVLDKLDIIIVNDGSSDNTAEAAEVFCRMYPDSIRLISQENKGHGGALNTGFAAARGKYLKPVDADDWVETQNLPRLIEALEHCESDVVLTHYNMVDISTGEVSKYKSYPEQFGTVLTMGELVDNFRSFYRCTTFHGLAYKTSFFREHSVSYSEHVFYEDNEYATFPFCHASSITPLDLFVYDYRVGDVNQSISLSNQVKRQSHTRTVVTRMLREYSQLSQGPGKTYTALKTQAVVMNYLMVALMADPDKKTARKQAAEQMALLQEQAPEIYAMLQKKYLVYQVLDRLHISKNHWEAFLHSRLYNRLRGNHDFD